MRVFIVLLVLGTTQVIGLASPMYTYLKGLCPPGLLPLTSSKHVKTCSDTCPPDARCIQGICCVRQPTCVDLTYMFPTSFSCLPSVRQNCPDGSKCVGSSRKGMSLCCSTKPTRKRPVMARVDRGVCPASHPVIQHDNKFITLCKHCNDGTCVPFRGSEVKVCCQSFESLCGTGSAVEMDGLLARDCTQQRCSEGFECSLTTAGSRVCCSYATCSSGSQARAICAGGCRQNEQCEEIQGQRWCCPLTEPKSRPKTRPSSRIATTESTKEYKCADNRKKNGDCSPMNPFCPLGFSCQPTEDGESYLCCENLPVLFTFPPPPNTTTMTTPTTTEVTKTTRRSRGKSFMTTTSAPPTCLSGEPPMEMEGTPLMCPEEGAACPKAGYICQRSSHYTELFCCPIDLEEETIEEPSNEKEVEKESERPSPPGPEDNRWKETNEVEEEFTTITATEKPVPIKKIRTKRPRTTIGSTLPPIFILPATTPSGPVPTCWIGHRPVRKVTSNEFRTCIGFLDFSCPLGSSCLPNATPGPMLTPQFICCKKI